MKLYALQTPVVVTTFSEHNKIKDSLLRLIDKRQKTTFETVTNTDWQQSLDWNREYVQVLCVHLVQHMQKVFSDLGYNSFKIVNVWFQQYEDNSYHDWHTHPDVNFTNVYYLELPKKEMVTQIKNPMDLNQVIMTDAIEGDILTIPAHVVHSSPINVSNSRKTVIAFNCSVEYIPK